MTSSIGRYQCKLIRFLTGRARTVGCSARESELAYAGTGIARISRGFFSVPLRSDSPRPRPRHRSAGFTLLELTVAMAISSIFFLSVFTLIWSTIETRQAIEASALPFATAPAVLNRLTEDLRHATTEPYKDGDTFKAELENVGGEDSTKLHLVSAIASRTKTEVDQKLVRAAINEIGWQCRRSETRSGLLTLYRREDFGVDDKPFEGGKFYKVVDGVRSFRLDWFDADPGDPDGDAAEGEEDWDASKDDGLPWGCRITLVLVPPQEVDDLGDPVGEPAEDLEFILYFAFPTRDNRPDQAPGQVPPR